nr:43kDa postsynaptic protein [Ipomoea batatas]
MVGGENENAKTICSICFEDLKPIVEDLQSISICGHVFHELWSVGETIEASFTQKLRDCEQNPEELRREVKRLQGRVFGLDSALEKHQKDLKDITEELLACKEQVKIEVTLKTEALKQSGMAQNLLYVKSKDLERSNSECTRLQERNLSLAKELAALKLVCDLNLEEEDVLKFASLGNEANSKETIDVLKRSLVIRNKSYKELMVKCNSLGRGEARCLSKLEKAKAKINKLKARVQELETAVEAKENEALRTLRTSKRTFEVDAADAFGAEPKFKRCSYEDQNKRHLESRVDLDQGNNIHTDLLCSRKKEKLKVKDSTRRVPSEDTVACSLQENREFSFLKDKDIHETSTCGNEGLYENLMPTTSNKTTLLDCHLSTVNASMRTISGIQVPQVENKEEMPSSRNSIKNSKYILPETNDANDDDLVLLGDTTLAQPSFRKRKETPSILAEPDFSLAAEKEETPSSRSSNKNNNYILPKTNGANDDDLVLLGDTNLAQPAFHIRKETSSSILAEPGDRCFSGGLLGPDGTNWHLGKWCKKVQNKGSTPAFQGSTTVAGDLIAVGADGRGGRVKVLRSSNHKALENNNASASAKRIKYGVKASSMQSQGCLQIEHFFSKAGQ